MTAAPLSARLALVGEVSREAAVELIAALDRVARDHEAAEIEFEDADLEEGIVTALLVDGLREASRRLTRLTLKRPPQALAHALYRIGALEQGGVIHVVEPREDFGSSS